MDVRSDSGQIASLQPDDAATTAKRRRQTPILEVSATTRVLAAVAGAGAFILGVVVASMAL